VRTKNLKIRYITDKKGNKKEVVLPIKDFNELIDDLEDLSVIQQRKNERIIKHEDVVKILKINVSL
jgi:hypothetical protein